MKKCKLHILLIAILPLIHISESFSQINLAEITGKRWKINLFFGDSVRYDTPELDSVSYEYMPDMSVRVYQMDQQGYNAMNYAIQGDSLILYAVGFPETFRYKLMYLDQNNLVYRGVYIDPETAELVNVEYRFKPE
jgi:hypothetical protein